MVVNLDGAWLPKFVQSWVVAVLFHCILAMGDIKQSQHQPACDAGKGEVCSSLGQNLLQVKTATQRTRTDEIRVVNEVPITIDYADMEDGESFGDEDTEHEIRVVNEVPITIDYADMEDG